MASHISHLYPSHYLSTIQHRFCLAVFLFLRYDPGWHQPTVDWRQGKTDIRLYHCIITVIAYTWLCPNGRLIRNEELSRTLPWTLCHNTRLLMRADSAKHSDHSLALCSSRQTSVFSSKVDEHSTITEPDTRALIFSIHCLTLSVVPSWSCYLLCILVYQSVWRLWRKWCFSQLAPFPPVGENKTWTQCQEMFFLWCAVADLNAWSDILSLTLEVYLLTLQSEDCREILPNRTEAVDFSFASPFPEMCSLLCMCLLW